MYSRNMAKVIKYIDTKAASHRLISTLYVAYGASENDGFWCPPVYICCYNNNNNEFGQKKYDVLTSRPGSHTSTMGRRSIRDYVVRWCKLCPSRVTAAVYTCDGGFCAQETCNDRDFLYIDIKAYKPCKSYLKHDRRTLKHRLCGMFTMKRQASKEIGKNSWQHRYSRMIRRIVLCNFMAIDKYI